MPDDRQLADLHRKLEELRLDVHDMRTERAEVKDAPEKADPLQHAIAAVGIVQGLQSVFEPLKAAIEKDSSKDAALSDRMADLVAAVTKQSQLIERQCEVSAKLLSAFEGLAANIAKPRKRTGTVNLPDGPVTMTVTEH